MRNPRIRGTAPAFPLMTALTAMALASSGAAQAPPPEAAPVHQVQADAPITAVTLYLGRAAITRSGSVTLGQGVHAIRFSGLPRNVQSETLQAKVGESARLVNVEYLETPVVDPTGSPQIVAIERDLESARQALAYLEEDRQQNTEARKLIDQFGVRATANATAEAATQKLEIDAVKKQLEFVQSERTRLTRLDREFALKIRDQQRAVAAIQARYQAMGKAESFERSAEVTIAVPTGGEVPISLTYLVTDAGWQPAYSVRGTADRSAVTIEFDATIAQRSGEDWNDVVLSISTAQPTVNANPPTISPIYVSVVLPPPPMAPAAVASPAPAQDMRRRVGKSLADAESDGVMGSDANGAMNHDAPSEALGRELERWAGGASVQEGGTAVTYELPRRVTVPTNADRMVRSRVATITPTASFVYTAIPLLTDAVYLRSQLVNDSPFQLIPGPAQVFIGPEYIGPTTIGSVAPKGEFAVYFGIDRSIRAVRTLVSKATSESGVFSKATETARAYSISIDNGSGRDIDVELFDRRPVSRDEKITVTVESMSAPLSTAPEYVRDLLPQGIMRWDLSVLSTANGKTPRLITWITKVSTPKDIQITHVPD